MKILKVMPAVDHDLKPIPPPSTKNHWSKEKALVEEKQLPLLVRVRGGSIVACTPNKSGCRYDDISETRYSTSLGLIHYHTDTKPCDDSAV